MTLQKINLRTKEGQLLLAALSILTQTEEYPCLGNRIKGTSQTPDQTIELLETLYARTMGPNPALQTKGLSFADALEAAKLGYKIARTGWNGSGMYAVIMPGHPEGIACNEVTAKVHGVPVGTVLKFRPYWTLKTAQNDIAMWAPSGSDSLAEDWIVIP